MLAPLVEQIGARFALDDYGPQALFPAPGEAAAAGFVSLLPDVGQLAVEGADAANFLHNQLTNDVEHLEADEARWYGYCSPKGRLLSVFLGWREGDGFALTVARPLAEPLRKRLSMYVLRAKAKISDRSAAQAFLGVGGPGARAALAVLGLSAPAPLRTSAAGPLIAIGLPPVVLDGDAPTERWLVRVPLEGLAATWAALSSPLAPVSSTFWRRTEVLSGIPRIVPGTSEQFVPQMVNLEIVGGVNFKKGCYPGQEIVARSQYLGKLKRRMFLAHLDGAEPAPGSDVQPLSGGEPIGQVVLAAPSPAGGIDLLVEARTDAIDAGTAIAGAPLRLRTLPYPMPTP